MTYTIQKLASLAGVSTRTLRYYDQIGLLHSTRQSGNQYRIYEQTQVDLLQQILLYREMGMELSVIRSILYSPDFSPMEALKSHLEELQNRERRLKLLIKNVKKTLEKEEGRRIMTDAEKFEGLKERLVRDNEEKYGEEIRSKYGDDKVEKSNAAMLKLSQEEYRKMQQTAEEINRLLEAAVEQGEKPSGEMGQKIARMHREWLSYTWSEYSPKAHQGLALMYVKDERFTAYYDSRVKGCAKFLCKAVEVMTEKQK